jgi:hypothetical protein
MTTRLQAPSELCCDVYSRVPTSNEASAWIDAVRTQRGSDALDSLKQGGIVNLVGCLVARMIVGLISVGRGWVRGRRCVVIQGVPVSGGDHQSLWVAVSPLELKRSSRHGLTWGEGS